MPGQTDGSFSATEGAREDLPMTANRLARIRTAPRGRVVGKLKALWTRVLFGWAVFLGVIVGASNCPFCGQTGCPQGIVSAGVLAGIVAAVTSGKWRFKGVKERTRSRAFGTARSRSRSSRR